MATATKSAWLQEVEDDAVRITQKRLNDQLAEMQYQKEKLAKEEKAKAKKEGDK
jgi:hypothetical protein